MLAVTHGSLAYYALLVSWLLFALSALKPRRRRRLYLDCGRPTQSARQATTRPYGTTAGPDDQGPAAGTRAGSPSRRPPGTPGASTLPPRDSSTTHTTHPPTSNGESHSTVWITTGDGAAYFTHPFGDSPAWIDSPECTPHYRDLSPYWRSRLAAHDRDNAA